MNDMQQTIEPNGSFAAHEMASGRALQQVRSNYATAVYVQKPRSLKEVERRLLDEARLSGEDFYYGWQAGKDKIEGASVKLAMAAARCWGNCAIENLPVQDMPDSWVFTACFVDLETGFTLTRQFRQSKKWTVYGKLDEDRKEDMRFQIGQSKAARNVVLNALPKGLIRNATEEAKKGVRASIEAFINSNGLPKAVDWIVKALSKHGVKEQQILGKVEKPARAGIDIDDLVILRGNLAALDGGEERSEALFPTKGAAASPTSATKGTDAVLGKFQQRVAKPAAAPAKTPAPEPEAELEQPLIDDEPIDPTLDPAQPPGDIDQDGAALADLVSDLDGRIEAAGNPLELQAVGKDMVKHWEWMGDEAYQGRLKLYQARSQQLAAARQPARTAAAK